MIDTAKAALIVATRMAADGLVPHAKTTGSKGLHVQAAIVPTAARLVVDYVRRVGVQLMAEHPTRFLLSQNKVARAGLTLIDVLQNQAARTTIVAYSLRGREHPTVSTPLTWDEVAEASLGAPLHFTAHNVPARLQHLGDPSADLNASPAAALPPA
jgi:bifunctional non-homologous end joining protein LigD